MRTFMFFTLFVVGLGMVAGMEWEKVTQVEYKISNRGRPYGSMVLAINKVGAPYVTKDFVQVMGVLQDYLSSTGVLKLFELFPQFKHDWATDTYETCDIAGSSTGKVFDDLDAIHMTEYGEDGTNYGKGTVFLQRRGTFFIAFKGNEKVCGTALGKIDDKTLGFLDLIYKLSHMFGKRHKRQTSALDITNISMK